MLYITKLKTTTQYVNKALTKANDKLIDKILYDEKLRDFKEHRVGLLEAKLYNNWSGLKDYFLVLYRGNDEQYFWLGCGKTLSGAIELGSTTHKYMFLNNDSKYDYISRYNKIK